MSLITFCGESLWRVVGMVLALPHFSNVVATTKTNEPPKKPWLFRVYRGIILPSYIGIIINHYKDQMGCDADTVFKYPAPIAQISNFNWTKGEQKSSLFFSSPVAPGRSEDQQPRCKNRIRWSANVLNFGSIISRIDELPCWKSESFKGSL